MEKSDTKVPEGVIIELAGMPSEGKKISGELPSSLLDIADESFFKIGRVFYYNLTVQTVPGELIVMGRLGLDVEYVCSMCSERFEMRVEENAFSAVCEIKAGDESVDLTADVREAILLAFSAYPVCKPDCKGICVQCGKNLNEGSCGCKASETDDRWGKLDILKK